MEGLSDLLSESRLALPNTDNFLCPLLFSYTRDGQSWSSGAIVLHVLDVSLLQHGHYPASTELDNNLFIETGVLEQGNISNMQDSGT